MSNEKSENTLLPPSVGLSINLSINFSKKKKRKKRKTEYINQMVIISTLFLVEP